MKMKTRTKKDWTALLQFIPPEESVHATEHTKTFIEEVVREYKKLSDKNDMIWLRSVDALITLSDWQVVRLTVKLLRKGVISDLYLPLTLKNVDDKGISIGTKNIFLSEEAMLEEALKNPRGFNKHFIGFRMKDWRKFQELHKKVYAIFGDTIRAAFDETTGNIIFQGKKCELPFKKLEYYIAKALFEKPSATKMTEDDLLKYFDLQSSRSESPSRIYDAVGRINKKASSYLGLEKLIGYKNSYYWLNNVPTE